MIAFSATVEVATGLALLGVPAFVAQALLGAELSVVGIVVARCFCITLLALALAVWPGRDGATGAPAFRAMLLYNVLIGLYLTWMGTHWRMGGVLLWPAVALHSGVAMLLALALLGVQDAA